MTKKATVASSVESLGLTTEGFSDKHTKEATYVKFNLENHFSSIKERSEQGIDTPQLGIPEKIGVSGVVIESSSRLITHKSKFNILDSSPNRSQSNFTK